MRNIVHTTLKQAHNRATMHRSYANPLPAQRPRLRHSMLWMLAGNILYMGCQWGVLVATVKLGAPAMVGRFSFAFAVCAPIFLFAQLRLRAASATDARLDFAPQDYLALRVLGILAAALAVALLCWLGRFDVATAKIIAIVAVAKAVESGSDVLYGISQHGEHMRVVAISMILRGVLSLAAFTLLLWHTHRLLPALLGFCLGWSLVFLFYDLPQAFRFLRSNGLRNRSVLHFQWPVLKRLTAVTLPLGLAAMLMSFAMNMPRYFVEHFRGSSELGIFSALSYLTLTGAVVVNSITEAAMPRFAQYMAARQRTQAANLLWRLLAITAFFSGAGIAVAACFSHPLLLVVYKAEYAGSTRLLVLLMIGAGLANLAAVCNYLLLAGRQMLAHLVSLVALTVLMAAACVYCVPRWGATGAAIASLLAFTVQLAWSGLAVRRALAGFPSQSTLPLAASGALVVTS